MKCSYRGVTYESKPTILETMEGEVGGKYRGQDWRYNYPRHIPQLQPKVYMQYRGVAYSTLSLPITEGNSKQEKAQTNACKASIRKPLEFIIEDATKIHLNNIRRNLEHRLQIAKANGDESLVNLLKNESKQLALNI